MVDITDFTNTTKFKIESRLKEASRPWGIPVGSLLNDCTRRLWYSFRWADLGIIDAKTQRIFDRGQMEEERIINDLISIGCKVKFVLHEQLKVTAMFGHERGKIDGLVYGTPEYPNEWVLLEIKTGNSNNFNGFVKNGIGNYSTYEGQVHRYLGHIKRNKKITYKDEEGEVHKVNIDKEFGKIDKCLFIMTNKNNEERYYEFVKYNEEIDNKCEEASRQILFSEEPPTRIETAKWYKCNQCNFRPVCHDNKLINRSCRTCTNVQWMDKGVIKCGLMDEELTIKDQIAGCDSYEMIEID